MPSSKKKLPTGPIRIDFPTQLPSEPSEEQFSDKLETKKQDSTLLEDSIAESSKKDSIIQENKSQETAPEELIFESSSFSQSQEASQPESSLTEYKKVAMRLSVEAVENLRQLRVETGIPYEILVDVMIRNWDNLPQRIQAAYLKQAKRVRMQRLMAGQEKTMKTMQQKFLEP
ncbi:MAG: hypothetical protein ACRDEA_00975 [Microcystaceae cyanobacterium]